MMQGLSLVWGGQGGTTIVHRMGSPQHLQLNTSSLVVEAGIPPTPAPAQSKKDQSLNETLP